MWSASTSAARRAEKLPQGSQPRPDAQALGLEDVNLGSAPQLQRLASTSGPRADPLTAISGLQRLDLFADDEKRWLSVLKQLAALVPHARQLTALVLDGRELLSDKQTLAELAASLRMLPGLRELEVRQVKLLSVADGVQVHLACWVHAPVGSWLQQNIWDSGLFR